MGDPIKEKIMKKIATRAQSILGGSYNTTISNVFRGVRRRPDADALPCISIFQREGEPTDQNYGFDYWELPLSIEMSDIGGDSIDEKMSLMEADLIEAFMGTQWTFPFNLGGLESGYVPNDIYGQTVTISPGNSYVIQDVTTVVDGWLSGVAEGVILGIRSEGTIPTGVHYIGGPAPGIGRLTCLTSPSEIDIKTAVFGSGLKIDEIIYDGSGISDYPEVDDTIVTAFLNVTLKWRTKYGNPYAQ